MIDFKTPGVYIREVEVTATPRLRFDITGFVGQAERGPLNNPQPLTNWGQYQDIFGDFVGYSFLPYAIYGFFQNGGERCYVVRVAHETATRATLDLDGENGDCPVRIEAINAGAWANDVTISIAQSRLASQGFRLIVRYLPGGRLSREEVFDELSLDEADERYFVRIINGDLDNRDYVQRIKNGNSILIHVEDQNKGEADDTVRRQALFDCFGVNVKALAGGQDGSTYFGEGSHRYFTGYEGEKLFEPTPDGPQGKLYGLATFEAVDQIGLVAIPDLILPDWFRYYDGNSRAQIPDKGVIFGPVQSDGLELTNLKSGQRDMLYHCEKIGDRFAILDAPYGSEIQSGQNAIDGWPEHFRAQGSRPKRAKNGALYYPWIKEHTADFAGRDLFIPPSGHVAGIYGRVEIDRGVGKAPANEILRGIVELEFCLTDGEQDILNPRGVNCLRILPGRGLRIWGARTLSLEPLWRYVNVRRLYLSIVKTILVNLQWTVFEPNEPLLWDKIVATLTLYFRDLFQSGALAGTSPKEAFFVKCDAETNPPEVVDRGQVITLVGFAPARPAEFILVTIKRSPGSLSVSEQTV